MKAVRDWIVRHGAALGGLAFVAAAAALAHLVWSPSGWNIARDGVLLAATRRLLDGQVPYRDFIWTQTPLALWLHLPLAAWAGDALFAWARTLLWAHLAAASWLWAWMADRFLRRPLGAAGLPLMAGLSFAVAAVSALPDDSVTATAFFWATAGLALRAAAPAETSRARIGYSLMGLAALCQFSFWIVAPVAILALGDARRPGAWLAAAAPPAALAAGLAAQGALGEAGGQLWGSIRPPGWYWNMLASHSMPALYAYLAMRWIAGVPPLHVPTRTRGWQRLAGGAAWGLILLLVGRMIYYTDMAFAPAMLWWALAGAWCYLLFEKWAAARAAIAFGALVLATALACCSFRDWRPLTVSTGIVSLPLLVWGWRGLPAWRRRAAFVLTGAAGLAVILGAAHLRPDGRRAAGYWRPPPLDVPRAERVCLLTGVLDGGAGLRTGTNVCAILRDLREAVRLAEATGQPYALLPDLAGHWPRARQANPLPLDWVADPLLDRTALHDRVIRTLDERRGQLVIIVQKFQGRRLADGRWRQPNWPAPVAHVRRQFQRFAETECFELYR